MQIKIDGKWEQVSSSGKPYKFPTEDQAQRMLEMCYPELIRVGKLGGEKLVRVNKFED